MNFIWLNALPVTSGRNGSDQKLRNKILVGGPGGYFWHPEILSPSKIDFRAFWQFSATVKRDC